MASSDDTKKASLRAAWDKAVERDRPKDALTALEGLEALDPREPRWPHRAGDVLRRLGRTKEAEAAYGRAMAVYTQQGFIARAVAVAKLITELNPSRKGLLDTLDQDATRSLRRASRPALPLDVGRVALQAALLPATSVHAKGVGFDDETSGTIAGVPSMQMRAVAAALPLAPAHDAESDEVRFADVPDDQCIELELSDLEPAPVSEAYELLDGDFEVVTEPSAERLALMTGATLFAEIPQEVLASLAHAAELVEKPDGAALFRRGDKADALYVIVEGAAHIVVPGLENGGVVLAEGQIFGEGCLLEGGLRLADVDVRGHLTALRIPKRTLDAVVRSHPAVGDVLFDLLLQRLVANTLQVSPLFAAFDPEARRDLSRLFEVRRAARGVSVTEFGKRSDGLYLALAGDLWVEDGEGPRPLQLGTMFGQESLLSQAPARRSVKVLREAVLLRMPAARFGAFAMQYPPALAHLAELASRSDAL